MCIGLCASICICVCTLIVRWEMFVSDWKCRISIIVFSCYGIFYYIREYNVVNAKRNELVRVCVCVNELFTWMNYFTQYFLWICIFCNTEYVRVHVTACICARAYNFMNEWLYGCICASKFLHFKNSFVFIFSYFGAANSKYGVISLSLFHISAHALVSLSPTIAFPYSIFRCYPSDE